VSALRIALLRAVNVGGRKVIMADLRDMLAGMGLGEPRTLLASGNAVFRSDDPAALLEARLEAAIQARFGLHSDVMIRTPAECSEALARGPFQAEAKAAPAYTYVMFLKAAPAPEALKVLQGAVEPLPEQVAVAGREAWLHYPDGAGRSKLTNQFIERRLGVRGTARNWNTVGKLAALKS
jgi:uncharacterized protein (DUF1697 family)